MRRVILPGCGGRNPVEACNFLVKCVLQVSQVNYIDYCGHYRVNKQIIYTHLYIIRKIAILASSRQDRLRFTKRFQESCHENGQTLLKLGQLQVKLQI